MGFFFSCSNGTRYTLMSGIVFQVEPVLLLHRFIVCIKIARKKELKNASAVVMT